MSRALLLQLALPLVKTHGFTREALSRSVLSLPTPHPEPLSDTAVSALFGNGDDARRTLIEAWLDSGREHMKSAPTPAVKDVLGTRLRYNEPVLQHLPEAFALLSTAFPPLPPLHLTPALKHVASVADEACHVSGDTATGAAWYTRRASLATVYGAAELHQLTSPHTAQGFLHSLLDKASEVERVFAETDLFARYIGRSWAGIINSRGIF